MRLASLGQVCMLRELSLSQCKLVSSSEMSTSLPLSAPPAHRCCAVTSPPSQQLACIRDKLQKSVCPILEKPMLQLLSCTIVTSCCQAKLHQAAHILSSAGYMWEHPMHPSLVKETCSAGRHTGPWMQAEFK